MNYFPSDVEWKLQARFLLSSCFAFVFVLCFQKAMQLTYLLGFPQQVCCCCPAAWHSTLLSGRELRTLQSLLCILASQLPHPAPGAKTLQCLHVAPSLLLRRGEGLVTLSRSLCSQSSWALCYSLGGEQEGNLPAVQAGDLKFGDL